MLQRLPTRLPFRLIEFPLGLAMVGGGAFLAWSGVELLPTGLGIAFLLVGLGTVILGAFTLVHSVTEAVPEWVVGRDYESPKDMPPAG